MPSPGFEPGPQVPQTCIQSRLNYEGKLKIKGKLLEKYIVEVYLKERAKIKNKKHIEKIKFSKVK